MHHLVTSAWQTEHQILQITILLTKYAAIQNGDIFKFRF